MKLPNRWVEARSAFTLIERFGLPIAVSSMEAQPLGLAGVLILFLFTRTFAVSELTPLSIAILMLGLLWWAMGVEALLLKGRVRKREHLLALRVLGYVGALAIFVGPQGGGLLSGETLPGVVMTLAVVTWLWRRTMLRARRGFEYGQLALSFKISFGVLLGILLVALTLPQGNLLLTMLEGSLIVFFLSGLVTLSLSRLALLRHTRRPDGSQADPTDRKSVV